MPLENVTSEIAPGERHTSGPPPGAPLAIQVEGLEKAFHIPTQKVDSLKERIVHPFSGRDYREMRALNGISFDVRKGEFFGIVGRNGSGKSTLLKILASIYRADAGTIRMAGRLAPFIELGVGFNAELSARENVVLNGVMMGLTPTQARNRLDAVIEFAELEEFADLKIKNYSSGMLVRLAFSVMLEADADVLLIDEVLAVGDASFQQKCTDVFHTMKEQGKTIVLVTHDMSAVQEYCHRAMLIADGEIKQIGDPADTGREYMKLNFEHGVATSDPRALPGGEGATLVDCQLESEAGEKLTAVESGEKIRLRATVEIERDASGVDVGFIIANADGLGLFEFRDFIEEPNGSTEVKAGDVVAVTADLDNPLGPGRHFIHCGIKSAQGDIYVYVHNALDFVVYGTGGGLLEIPHEVESVVTRKGNPA